MTSRERERERNGRRAFDFLAGVWRVQNRMLRSGALGGRAEWIEFESAAESRPILGGLGNADAYYVADFPGRGEYRGFALRLFEPSTGLWRIWWASTADPGRLDPPLAGRFTDGEGHFEGDDHIPARRSKCGSAGRTSRRFPRAGSSRSRSTTARRSTSTG
jgi:hypothetical protein